ncbi:glycerate kinase [Rothia nasisuis]|uniref:glycerate kinase n=1 Tax=Rothia nasisuis TaxID=2109647 RepID=UPI001F3B830A|nr:glycerate kinase [Rothia nasisuis]
MKVLLAVDKFKGTLTGVQLTEALAAGLEGAGGCEVVTCPIADGGDGTVDAALAAGYSEVTCTVTGPFAGQPVTARYAYLQTERTAVLEIAEAGGIARLREDQLDTWRATSYGAGELILQAVGAGARTLIIGLGGSASTDGGAGLMQALGVRFQDAAGHDLAPGGGALGELASVDLTGLDERLADVDIIMASDVTNPLTGPAGAAAVYGPQKGATEEQVPLLDLNLQKLADAVENALKVSRGTFARASGAGAAGGLGFACLSVLGATMRPGVEVCFELTGFYKHLEGADLVITGEGKFDRQTLQGKGPAGVAAAARERDIPALAVCGVRELAEEDYRAAGFTTVYSVVGDTQATLEESLANPRPYLQELAATISSTHLR